MEENKKSNKGLIITIVCLIVLLAVALGYIVYEKALSDSLSKKNSTNTTESTTTTTSINNEAKTSEEVIINNFYSRISNVKQGVEDKILLCNVSDEVLSNIDCTKIQEFNIEKVELVEKTNSRDIYSFEISWTCENNEICFYNEQIETINNKNYAKTFYAIKDGIVIESLGNDYLLGE